MSFSSFPKAIFPWILGPFPPLHNAIVSSRPTIFKMLWARQAVPGKGEDPRGNGMQAGLQAEQPWVLCTEGPNQILFWKNNQK